MTFFAIRDICLGVTACLLLGYSTGGLSGQTRVGGNDKFNHDIRCAIQAERRQWNRNSESTISGTIENLADGPLELDVDSTFHLSSRTSHEMSDTFWAPADLLHDGPMAKNKRDIGSVGVGIEPRGIHLRFKDKGDKIDFRINAQHLLWAKEISSVWPSSFLFSTVKSGDYELQLVMETENGRVESPKVYISIDASKPPKQ
jgi:hypothetical protein